ncbi:splicing factor, arginine/serine-rich 19-like [Bicyclus anynana]|uniref:Splicing factor, arginine/serine-rich 19-like n=1 Tax=Bicyclus anynana TaxID=110368 RepID=A0ABM3LWD2_BICAN|nr:splicing factor, arginine/serine-rich 19-like [Bicyclus anynana]
MADDNTIIEGTVKFRDGKKWKSRWCVMRKLSPVADCVQLQVYRDARARCAGASSKAALSLQHFLGCETGFTLDKHSHTLALLCQDFTAVLAFETRERLMQWQVKLGAALGSARPYLVLVGAGGGGARRLAAGPARLHLRERRCALSAGVPPRLLGVWDIAHLRRYGVVEGRFCFEGGSLCGAGEGLHVLLSDQAADIERAFRRAARAQLSPCRRPQPGAERSLPPSDLRLYEDPAEAGAGSPCWPSAERARYPDLGFGDAASVHEAADEGAAPWGGGVSLERCTSCMSKLGALSRSSTAALTPGATHFSPAWTMESPAEPAPPERPPAPPRPDAGARRPPPPPPARSFSHSHLASIGENDPTGVGPYENYDVPKIPSAEVEGEYYDTPKRLKECLNGELFKITKSSTSSSLVLKKPCGCLLRLGRTPRPLVVEDEPAPVAACPCRRVTAWAHSWLRLPACRAPGDEPAPDALYASVDFSRKTRRRAPAAPVDPPPEVDDGPLANYENLSFALSLEHYENAKELLRRAGVTSRELHALGAALRPPCGACGACGQPRPRPRTLSDEYLLMAPGAPDGGRDERAPPAGYAPMSPIGGFGFRTLRRPARSPVGGALDEKSASNPALGESAPPPRAGRPRAARRERSSSADSSRFLDDVQEFDGARGSASSLETLRDAGADGAPARCGCKHSDADSSEASKAAGGAAAAGARDSSSSNDSGVSSWSLAAREARELPATSAAARRRYRSARRAADSPRAARRSRSSGGPPDAHSTSSGTSDMSDYVETLSICSSQSSSDAPETLRVRQAACTLRPRSGKEYQPLAPHLAARR